jgi:hypothetical protein
VDKEIKAILREFGAACYWYGEDTGDYDIVSADNRKFFKDTVTKLKALLDAGERKGEKS